jgi:hypothetical protein
MKKTLKVANGIALVVTIVMNYLSNSGVFNGNTMKTISDKYHNYFTPAGYAFSIWGLIYLGLLGFVLFTGRDLFTKKNTTDTDPLVEKIGWWFALSCAANSFWVVAWLYDYIGLSVLIMIVLLFSLLMVIKNTRMELDYHPFKNYVFIFWPFALYAGWITVALIADIAAWLTKVGWDGWGLSEITWTIIMIVVAGLINIFMVWQRNLREYALVGIWALIAIAVSNENKVQSILYTCYIVSAIILVSIIMSGFKNRHSSLGGM